MTRSFKVLLIVVFIAVCMAVLAVLTRAQGSLPVVPGAYGYGMETRAAYGCGSDPVILRVTNLSDDIPAPAGSLRAALENVNPRVIIFEVSGYITLVDWVEVATPCVTIAGQTAPSPGVTLRWPAGYSATDGYGFFIPTHDVLIQHLAIRPGMSCNTALAIYNYLSGDSAYNVVVDHVSVGWAEDDGFNTYYANTHDVSFWRSLSAEALYYPTGSEVCAGGGLDGGHGISLTGDDISVIQSLFAHNFQRNPENGPGNTSYMANNVVYNANEAMMFQMILAPHTFQSSIIGNYIKRGNHVSRQDYFVAVRWADTGAALYMSGNTTDNGGLTPAIIDFEVIGDDGIDPRVGSPPITAPTGYTPLSAAAAYTSALLNAGTRPAERDAVDARVVAAVEARTGALITNISAVGGYPTLAENYRALTTPANPHLDSGDGYRNLEKWLHGYSNVVEGTDEPPLVDVPDAAGDVFVSAAFTGSAGTNLTSYTGETGATFAAASGSSGQMVLTDANRARSNHTDDYASLYTSGVPLSVQYDVEADFRIFSIIPGNFYSLWARMSTAAFTGYLTTYNTNNLTFALSYYNAGAPTTLMTAPYTLTVGQIYNVSLLVRDGSKSVKVNGVPILYSTDNTITSTGRAGLSVFATTSDTNSTGIHFDNLLSTDVSETPEPPITLATWGKGRMLGRMR